MSNGAAKHHDPERKAELVAGVPNEVVIGVFYDPFVSTCCSYWQIHIDHSTAFLLLIVASLTGCCRITHSVDTYISHLKSKEEQTLT